MTSPLRSVRAHKHEKGAIATIVVTLLALGGLLAFTAISVDVGRGLVERRQLQNGADAGALSLAKSCAQGNCTPGADGLEGLVDANASDAAGHDVLNQCGSPASGLPPCPGSSLSDIGQCPPVPAGYEGAKYVEVRTGSRSASGSFILNLFGQASGADTTSVQSCARAAWGPIKSAPVLPLTFRDCEYEEAIAAQGFGNDPVDPTAKYKGETALPLKYDTKVGAACDPLTAPSGGDFDGGFGWLQNTNCISEITSGHWVQTQTGVGGGNQCLDQLTAGQTIFIPLHDCIADTDANPPCTPGSPSGNNAYYHITGFAAFFVTAIDLTGKTDKWKPTYPGTTAQKECNEESLGGGSSKGKCIFGWFLDDYVAVDAVLDPTPGAQETGAWVVEPLG